MSWYRVRRVALPFSPLQSARTPTDGGINGWLRSAAEMNAGDGANEKSLESQGEYQMRESAVGSNPGAPTWPIPVPDGTSLPPPVGLNWGQVAQHFGADVRILMHGCYIVLQGEFVPETGYFIDPQTLRARRVD